MLATQAVLLRFGSALVSDAERLNWSGPVGPGAEPMALRFERDQCTRCALTLLRGGLGARAALSLGWHQGGRGLDFGCWGQAGQVMGVNSLAS